jgi:hypothetical protein
MLHVQAACPCSSYMFLSRVHDHVNMLH